MKKLKMLVELKYDKIIEGNSREEKDWFRNDILINKRKDDLFLHSNEIGEEVGVIKVIKIIKD